MNSEKGKTKYERPELRELGSLVNATLGKMSGASDGAMVMMRM